MLSYIPCQATCDSLAVYVVLSCGLGLKTFSLESKPGNDNVNTTFDHPD